VRPFDVLIAAHGPLADALMEAAVMVCGPVPRVTALSLSATDSPESFRRRVEEAIDNERPTLVLTDLYGGTPHNVLSEVAMRRGNRVEVIAGANLGLVIEAVTTVEEPLDAVLVARLATLAREAVVDVSERLAAR
jgi:PTS system mannose-specific IIA component